MIGQCFSTKNKMKYNIPKRWLVFDVESIGLHGEGFSVGGGVFIDGAIQYGFTLSCDPSKADGADDDREWVDRNIPVLESTHRDPYMVRQSFWELWQKEKENGTVMAAECAWPVEANFLSACIMDDPQARKFSGPYPLYEISAFMAAAGLDPLASYDRTPSEEPRHNPYADAVQSARLLFEALGKLK